MRIVSATEGAGGMGDGARAGRECPHCGARLQLVGPMGPRPGDFAVCVTCGGLGRVMLDASVERAVLTDIRNPRARAQAAVEIIEIQARNGKSLPEPYLEAADRLERLLYAADSDDLPRFALPPLGTLFSAGLHQVGHKLARNDAAHAFIDAACEGTEENGPTVMMLSVLLEMFGIGVVRVPLDELVGEP